MFVIITVPVGSAIKRRSPRVAARALTAFVRSFSGSLEERPERDCSEDGTQAGHDGLCDHRGRSLHRAAAEHAPQTGQPASRAEEAKDCQSDRPVKGAALPLILECYQAQRKDWDAEKGGDEGGLADALAAEVTAHAQDDEQEAKRDGDVRHGC